MEEDITTSTEWRDSPTPTAQLRTRDVGALNDDVLEKRLTIVPESSKEMLADFPSPTGGKVAEEERLRSELESVQNLANEHSEKYHTLEKEHTEALAAADATKAQLEKEVENLKAELDSAKVVHAEE